MEQLEKTVLERSKEGKIACKEALKIAESLSVSPAEVGQECNRLKIKIAGCQLGCFK